MSFHIIVLFLDEVIFTVGDEQDYLLFVLFRVVLRNEGLNACESMLNVVKCYENLLYVIVNY